MTVAVDVASGVPDAAAAWDAGHRLGAAILARSGLPLAGVSIRVNANRRSLVNWAVQDRVLRVSVHHALVPATDDLVALLRDRGGDAWTRLRALHAAEPQVASEPPALISAGEVHDLASLRAGEVGRLSGLAGDLAAVPIGWGRWPGAPPRAHLRLGSCELGASPVIRIHPVLDHGEVPGWFVGFVVFHELLHVVYPPVQSGNRRRIHSRVFEAAERRHPEFTRANAWERAHVSELLRRVRAEVNRRRGR